MQRDVLAELVSLARAGQQGPAIDLATAALSAPGLDVARRAELLDLRAEALIAEGRFADAARDAGQMAALVDSGKHTALRIVHAVKPPKKFKFAGQRLPYDHRHRTSSDKGVLYAFETAHRLMEDFFAEADRVIKEAQQ